MKKSQIFHFKTLTNHPFHNELPIEVFFQAEYTITYHIITTNNKVVRFEKS